MSYSLGLASVFDDAAWKDKQNQALGRATKDPINERVIMGLGTLYNIVGAQGIFQAAGHISKLSSGGGGVGRAIATTAAGTAAALAIPGKSLLAGLSDMVFGQPDRSSIKAAMVANIPIVNTLYNGKAINRFGDVIGDRSWYAQMVKFGSPIAIRVSDNPENKALYQMILDKGTAPPDLRRYIIEEKYGPLTQSEWNQFTKLSGDTLKKSVVDNLAQLQTMPSQAVHQFMVNAGASANDQAAATLKLEPVATTGRAASTGTGSGGGGTSAATSISMPKPPKISTLGLPQAPGGGGRVAMAGARGVIPSPSSSSASAGAIAPRRGFGRVGRSGGMLRRVSLGGKRLRKPRLVSGRLRARSGRIGRVRLSRGSRRRKLSLRA
jgi:hypothetical protein